MIKEIKQNTQSGFYSKLKIENNSADEFQATVNKIKENEEKEEKQTQTNAELTNFDLNLKKTLSNFVSYAQNKLYEDGLKRTEDNQIKKLFKLIDENNKNK